MTWTRLSDDWTDRADIAELSLSARWHYLACIQFCSRSDRVDGRLTVRDARRCSDVDDPDEAVRELVTAGLLDRNGNVLRVVQIAEHVPPPSVRNSAEQARIRKRRGRAHQSGDHTFYLPEHCAVVRSDVTRDIGTGRDRTGQAARPEVTEGVTGVGDSGGDGSDEDAVFLSAREA